MQQLRPSWVEISQAALRANLAYLRRSVPAGTGVVAMVKADAYGHGAVHCAQWLAAAGVTALGVATVEEGIELRNAGLFAPIIVMGGCAGQSDATLHALVAHQLTAVLHDAAIIPRLAAAVTAVGVACVACHLKIDTGMHRLGSAPAQVPDILAVLSETAALQLTGVMTHFACSDDLDRSAAQLAELQPLVSLCRNHAPNLIWHVANSGAILQAIDHPHLVRPFPLQPAEQLWVRPGVMLYGIAPFPACPHTAPLVPVLSMKSQIVICQSVSTGERVSYGGVWQAARPSRIAVIPVGYADGYPWNAVGQAHCLIGGERVPLVGRITMDMVMADVTDLPAVQLGEEVVLLGAQGKARITAEELAAWAGTIPYEIVCRISKRMPRRYVD